MTLQPLYTAEALATGAGRNGHVRTADGLLDTQMAVPQEMGGPGGAPNPELLFAAGYAACFHSALQLVARNENADLGESAVGAKVSIGKLEDGGFGLAVELEVVIPGQAHEQAVQLAHKAHQVCPYSNATRGNIAVEINVVED
ncbi:organic hydroperoxide resistance protein [Corynebacterium sp. 153RC1]|uniref:organic hydroperoxide resistance protein n=1 Tax=unclassified Corynebacterium TaxID=2624378 RepID=UPI00211BB7A4|nr:MULTISPECIES: organic hydroperoxide resistance protein [unclassified Corynebacterium]MCQ9371155.1 organic hydroperoxide resistance protein [Corynebacterium sp. 35RC1]MCQ9352544.1 organic hydroperoxide resistance protein [Corynebacterium sp. 209RC1]MCQ9354728.1 organic hydroperoxide resistance protein [Corynebacterium sp. 1222RC1]MCQ9356839.1 organic hydroperoxide resistance protein [Corynebacterium sp. 122RC1]MCQ9358957.1 organic hydroperoxide resistance protein [Corynebacterium sp. 142RC1]